jgi:hypothetical protein
MTKNMTKICVNCKKEKSLVEFYKRNSAKDGFHNSCKTCHSLNSHKNRTPEKARKSSLERDFGITLEDFKEILIRQRGVCAICGNPETSTYKGKLRNLSVDHNHKTNHLRGLLCDDCNKGLGFFWDNIERLRSAIQYLDYWKENGNRIIEFSKHSLSSKAKIR